LGLFYEPQNVVDSNCHKQMTTSEDDGV